MRFTSIASGSSGNCSYVSSGQTHILVDAGISCKRITDALNTLGIHMRQVQGIFVTHEHIDHIRGLYIIAKKYHVPIYATEGTVEEIQKLDKNQDISGELYHVIQPDEWLQIGDIQVFPFRNTHDAADPVGFRLESGDFAVAVATDLGNFSQYTVRNLLGLDGIIIEANHDIRMLQVGPYPYSLKRRIMSDYGHLSNERCGQLLCEIMNRRLRHVFLGHLSKENNIPDLAYAAVLEELQQSVPDRGLLENLHLIVAKRDEISEIIDID